MQEDVLVMDVGCACDVLWMYVMNYVCVLCDAKCLCAVSCIIYEFCVFAFEGKQQTNKNCKFPSFAECQHSAKKSLPSARGVALGKAEKKCRKKQPLPQFSQMVPLGKDYF